jgi:exopolysaccharide biosynthesis polyprenyl glycosylphosphotransferase
MKNRLRFKKLILLAGDLLVLYFSLYLTLLIRHWQTPGKELWQSHLGPFSIIFLGWIVIFYIAGLYDLRTAVNNASFFQLALRSIAIAGLLSIAIFYLNLTPQTSITPKRNLLIYIIVFAVLFHLWRHLFNWLLKSYIPKNNIAIIGFNNQTKELIEELREKPHLGYSIAFVVDDKNGGLEKINNIPVIKGIGELNKLILENKITTIILTSDPHQSPELRASLFNYLPLKISYVNLSNFYETITGKVPIESINQMWFLENLSEGSKSWFDALKRFYDVIFSSLILIITIVFWLPIGLIIKLESKGPIFFTQIRYGKNNKSFKIIKFRTMAMEGNDFSPTRSSDSRITKFGSFLRKTRLDELPQMLNILKGEMSFVGPRPERPELIKELQEKIPFYRERMLVKPGITGSDQISGEYHSPSYEDSLKKLQYDLFYIKNRSIYLDLSIILKTIATVVSRRGV